MHDVIPTFYSNGRFQLLTGEYYATNRWGGMPISSTGVNYGASVSGSNYTMLNKEHMLLPPVVQDGQTLLPARFHEISQQPGTDQTFTIDLGQERIIYEIGTARANPPCTIPLANWMRWISKSNPPSCGRAPREWFATSASNSVSLPPTAPTTARPFIECMPSAMKKNTIK